MSTNFSDLLNTDVTSVKRVTMPTGTYRTQVKGHKDVTSSKKKTKGIEVSFQGFAPGKDVDADALKVFTEVKKLDQLKMTNSFWITDADSLNYVKDFLAACGMSLEGRTFRQALSEATGCIVDVYIGHEASQRDPSVAIAKIQGFSKAE